VTSAPDIDRLLARLRAEGEHETYPPATDADIAKTETALGRPLPDSYKTFVGRFSNGAYIFTVQEVSAVGDGNPQIRPIQGIDRIGEGAPDEVIPFREGGETVYGNLVPFGLDHNGNEWCFVIESERPANEYGVAYFDTNGRRLYAKLGSFTEWLSILIEEQDEVIRTPCDDEVIYDELQLG
jgi:SMI1 / KNR4 family (SUKH-1)